MPQHQRKQSFGPQELKTLDHAFAGAWEKLRAAGLEQNTFEQIELIKTNLAQWIVVYAMIGESDVEHLKEDGLNALRSSSEFFSKGLH
jgi:hypothetical protein